MANGEPVNERPLLPALYRADEVGVSHWATDLTRQLITVFQQYGFRINQSVTEDALAAELADVVRDAALAAELADVVRDADILDVVRDADILDVLREGTSGVVIQQAFTSTGGVVSTTSPIPFDDTIPQVTEGGEALSIEFMPKSAGSRIRIRAVLNMRFSDSGAVLTAALFTSNSSDALRVSAMYAGGSNSLSAPVTVFADIPSPGTSTFTISARFGGHSAGTMYLNGQSAGGRLYGGVYCSFLEVTEYMP